MRIAAAQFPVSGSIQNNFEQMKSLIERAAERQVRLLLFPECALTGYPPYDLAKAADADVQMVTRYQQDRKSVV